MQIGESTSGSGSISGGGDATVSVPAGETWKFTIVAAAEANNNPYNSNIDVGFYDGTNKWAMAHSGENDTPPVGGFSPGSGRGSRSLTLGGDNHDLYINNSNSNTTLEYFWCATRVS